MAKIYKFKKGVEERSTCCAGCGAKKARGNDETYDFEDPKGKIVEILLDGGKRFIDWTLYKSGWTEVYYKEKRPKGGKMWWTHFEPLYYCPVCAYNGRMPHKKSPKRILKRLFISKVLKADFGKKRDFKWMVQGQEDNP